ncbi:MAG: glycosyltransferase family 2 protein [Patescibacteria group bacterium]|nr:glycosyltransferase family 2 protein [Patescibacteria group bacterium]
MPKVSIIMPAYNVAASLAKAVESVKTQSFLDWELILINDNSSDDTERVAESLADQRIIYLKNSDNKGLVHNLNRGLALARGEYIARLDGDDFWSDKDKLQKQVDFLDKNASCALVGTMAKVFDAPGRELFKIIFPEKNGAIKKQLLTKNCFVHSSVMFRKNAAAQCGNYRADEKLAEDYGLWLRLGEKYELANLADFSVGYLLNQSGATQKNNLKQIKASLNVIKKHKSNYPNYFLAGWRWRLKYVMVYFGGLKLINKLKSF